MQRMLLVFSHIDTHIGKGLNFKISDEEEARLTRVVKGIKKEFDVLGTVAVAGEYPTYALATMAFLGTALDVPQSLGSGFVGMQGLVEKLAEEKWRDVETLIVSCIAFYPQNSPSDSFFPELRRKWGGMRVMFGMPPIPDHQRDGDQSVLLIDTDQKKVVWLDKLGKSEQIVETAASS